MICKVRVQYRITGQWFDGELTDEGSSVGMEARHER